MMCDLFDTKDVKSVMPCIVSSFYQKYKEQILYLIFGVLTTIVNYASFVLLRWAFGDAWIHVVNAITFVLATLFAYVTNRIFVFKSTNASFKNVIKELVSFFGARISTYLFEALGFYLCVDVFGVGRYHILFTDGIMISKILLSFVAVILNYFVSKLWIFKNTGGKTDI